MSDRTVDLWVSRPMKEVIREVARSVAESQEDLDRRSMAVQREIERAVERGELPYEANATWLQFSEVDVDLQVAVSLEGREETRDGELRAIRPGVTVAPIGPRYAAAHDVNAEVTSDVRLKIVPVPPERRRS